MKNHHLISSTLSLLGTLLYSQLALSQPVDLLARYAVVSGGFGRQSAGGVLPVPESRGDAAQIADAMIVTPDGSGAKTVGITWGAGVRGLTCAATKFGACTLDVLVVVNSFDPKTNALTFEGRTARLINDSFKNVPMHSGPDGGRKSVANIVCYEKQEVGGGAMSRPVCRVRDFMFTSAGQTLRQIVQAGFLTEAAAMQLIKDAGVK